jgi:hypothetical protein
MSGQVMMPGMTRMPMGLAGVTAADNMAGRRARSYARAGKGT